MFRMRILTHIRACAPANIRAFGCADWPADGPLVLTVAVDALGLQELSAKM